MMLCSHIRCTRCAIAQHGRPNFIRGVLAALLIQTRAELHIQLLNQLQSRRVRDVPEDLLHRVGVMQSPCEPWADAASAAHFIRLRRQPTHMPNVGRRCPERNAVDGTNKATTLTHLHR